MMEPIQVYAVGVLSFFVGWGLATWRLRCLFQKYENQLKQMKGIHHA